MAIEIASRPSRLQSLFAGALINALILMLCAHFLAFMTTEGTTKPFFFVDTDARTLTSFVAGMAG
jgi:hypothetical protein